MVIVTSMNLGESFEEYCYNKFNIISFTFLNKLKTFNKEKINLSKAHEGIKLMDEYTTSFPVHTPYFPDRIKDIISEIMILRNSLKEFLKGKK